MMGSGVDFTDRLVSMTFHAGEPMSGKKSLASVPNCIFCYQPADSEEDAFPKWLIRWLDERYPEPPKGQPHLVAIPRGQEVVELHGEVS